MARQTCRLKLHIFRLRVGIFVCRLRVGAPVGGGREAWTPRPVGLGGAGEQQGGRGPGRMTGGRRPADVGQLSVPRHATRPHFENVGARLRQQAPAPGPHQQHLGAVNRPRRRRVRGMRIKKRPSVQNLQFLCNEWIFWNKGELRIFYWGRGQNRRAEGREQGCGFWGGAATPSPTS